MRAGLTLARDFTHVVIDSPPCLELSDAVLLSLIVDGVILVACAGQTPRPALIRARDQLLRAKAPLLGVVLNAVDVRTDGYGYYGSYYTAYHGSGENVASDRRTA
jgi:Mrp family chromosome partitioning ATPase